MFREKPGRIYLDHAAATPLDTKVLQAMKPYWKKAFHNPGGLAREHVLAKSAVEDARREVAASIGAQSSEVVFTCGGTESVNMAIRGAIEAFQQKHPEVRPHVLISTIEHAAARSLCQHLAKVGIIELTEIPIDEDQKFSITNLKNSLKKNTALVVCMYANNEVGMLLPVREITKTVRWFKKQHNQAVYPLVYTDAIQAVNYCDVRVQKLGVDLLTVSGAKIYGPKGIALLYVKKGTPIHPIIYGGGQERGLRPGTENVPAIVGFSKALSQAVAYRAKETERMQELKTYFCEALADLVDLGVSLTLDVKTPALPNIISITVSGISSERLVIELDARGIVCSAKSACSSGDTSISPVIAAIHPQISLTDGVLRFSMGRETQKRDIAKTVKVLKEVVSKIRNFNKKFTSAKNLSK